MVEKLAGKWKLDRSENFDDYLKEMGVGMIKRKAAGGLTQHVNITVSGNHVNMKTTTTLSKQEADFDVGSKFKSPAFGLADGEMECDTRMEGGKLVIEANPLNCPLKATKITREIVGDELVTVMTCNAVECKRIFKRE